MPFGANCQFKLAHKRFTYGNLNSTFGNIDLTLWLMQEAEKKFDFTVEFSWGPFRKQHCEVWLEDGRIKAEIRRSGSNTSNTITLVSLKLDFLLSQGLIPE